MSERYHLQEVCLAQLSSPIYLRKATSDAANLKQIFDDLQYSVIPGFPDNSATILDLGGYIGLAAIYFATRFPQASVYLVEPDRDNFILASLNCRPYPNIHLLHAGVWDHSTTLTVAHRVAGDWSTSLRELTAADSGCPRIPGHTVCDLLRLLDLEHVDLLKMDIEGAEKRLFAAPEASHWISRCGMIACELHDRVVPGCRFAAYQALGPLGFRRHRHGEVDLFTRSARSDAHP